MAFKLLMMTQLIWPVTGSFLYPSSDYSIFGQDDHTHFWGENWKKNQYQQNNHCNVLSKTSHCKPGLKVPLYRTRTSYLSSDSLLNKPVKLPCTTDQKQWTKTHKLKSCETKIFRMRLWFLHALYLRVLLHASFVQTISSYLLLMSVSGFSSLGRMAMSS